MIDLVQLSTQPCYFSFELEEASRVVVTGNATFKLSRMRGMSAGPAFDELVSFYGSSVVLHLSGFVCL